MTITYAEYMKKREEEYMKKIEEDFKIHMETKKLNKNLPETIQEITKIFKEYGIHRTLFPSEVAFGNTHFGNKIIINWDIASQEATYTPRPNLSEILFDHYYPKPQSTYFYHFTTLEAAYKILKPKKFRLYNLIKNYDFDEFKPFYKDHFLTGYNTSYTPDGVLYENRLMKQTFALSLVNKQTLSPAQENYMWHVFSEDHKGVKLELEITTSHIDFREIYYNNRFDQSKDLLINALDKHFREKYNRRFAFSKVSKFGGFYLPSTYKMENETRFLIKKYTDDYDFNFSIINESEETAYIELPFRSNYGHFKIKAIHLGKECDKQKAENKFSKINMVDLIKPFA